MKDKLKIKVIVGFVVATLLVLAVSFFTISNFLQLQESINRLSLPDHKLLLINKLLTDISKTETLVRSYTITRQDQYLQKYFQNSEIIDENLDSLKSLTRQSKNQYAKIDSLDILWDLKMENLTKYITLKEREKKRDFSARAINKVARQFTDSIKRMRTIQSTNITEMTQVPQPRQVEDVAEDENDRESSVLNWVTGIFGNKKNKEKTRKKQNKDVAETEVDQREKVDTMKTIAERQIRYDTVIVQEDASNVIDKVVTILEEIKEQESRFSALVTQSEYQLLLDDIMIMENVQTMITEVQMEEMQHSREQTSQSRIFAEKSINVIFIVGLFGLVVSAIFIYLIVSDISKSNFYKKRLEKAKRKAEKLAKVKEEFLANMSHEIRTPLSAILGFTDQLTLTSLQQKQRYYLQAIKNSSVHLLNTVNDILDFSKLEAGKLTIEDIPFKLNDELEEVVHIFKLKAEEKNIELIKEVNFNPDQVIAGDAFRIKQILLNLVSNALKFTEKGQVRLAAEINPVSDDKNLELKIKVADTGTGIPADKISSIFRGFEQADTSITRKFGGTGLGLAISRRLAGLMNGEI
ncbi:MAG: ATP-binding protein, partial [Cyclobacteriaceae bacterium]